MPAGAERVSSRLAPPKVGIVTQRPDEALTPLPESGAGSLPEHDFHAPGKAIFGVPAYPSS